MENAIAAYLAASTLDDLHAAYDALLENFAADPDIDDDADFAGGVDNMLNNMGLPSYGKREDEILGA